MLHVRGDEKFYRNFVKDIFKCIVLNESVEIPNKISLEDAPCCLFGD